MRSARKTDSPIKSFPDFEHLEAKGQDQIDEFLRLLRKVKAAARRLKRLSCWWLLVRSLPSPAMREREGQEPITD